MLDRPGLTYAEAAQVFVSPSDRDERIGLELECGLLDPDTGRCVDYAGVPGARSFIASAIKEFGGEPVVEAGYLVGAHLPSGAHLSLELGGALEYSSTPYLRLGDLIEATRRDMLAIADLAWRAGIAVMPAGMLPFTAVSEIAWIPKPRVQIMRRYFHNLGAAAASAEGVMGLTLSTQTSLDYTSEADLVEKLRLMVKASPIAASMFVNSPLERGEPTGVLSRRMQMWEQVDPSRCGVLGFAASPDLVVGQILDWVLGLPMIYRVGATGHVLACHRTFEQLMRCGFDDGTMPGIADWESHLSQLWPQVRPRRTLELRASDGLGWTDFAASPAFWVGLIYDDCARRSALALLDDISASTLDTATTAVAIHGLQASVGHQSVGALAAELLNLADLGLRARVASGIEAPGVPSLLDPLWDVVRTGTTFAQRYLADWLGPLRERPAALVAAHRVRSDSSGS